MSDELRTGAGEDYTESLAVFRSMYESTTVGIGQVSLDHRYMDANPGLCAFLGYSREELVGMSVWEVIQESDQETAREMQGRLARGEIERFQAEGGYLRKDGEVVWGLLDANLIRDADGNPQYCVGNLVDITERMRAESEVQRLSVGVEQSPVSIVITDPHGVIEYVNSKFCAISGYTREEAIGLKPSVLKSGEQSDEYYAEMWRTITLGETWKGEFHNKRKDGTLYWEEATIGPITSETGEITSFIAFKQDITEQKDLQLRLLQSQRLEAIGQLAGGIAHDFNNLLTVINGYSALLMESIGEDDTLRGDLQQIVAAGERAGTLTHQLLAFSRKQVIRPATLSLNTLVTDITSMLRRLVGEHVVLRTNLADDLRETRVDPVQMNQIIMNLVVNSRDALPDGGEVTLSTQNFQIDDSFSARHLGASPGMYCLLTVSDNGVGMDPLTREHAFEPFFTTKGIGEGTGLGLSTVYGIVKQHDGYVWLYSEEGQGTTVRVYLPEAPTDKAVDTDPGIPPASVTGTETILLVEDDDTVRGLTAGILERAGYSVFPAPDGRSALQLFAEHINEIDVVVSDVVMPGMGGKELADAILQKKPDMRVIFVSGYTDEAISRAGVLKENAELITKPFHPSELLLRVRTVLDRD
jgi:two-component system cell cycle sensor histidine kinase/response regulator CckA